MLTKIKIILLIILLNIPIVSIANEQPIVNREMLLNRCIERRINKEKDINNINECLYDDWCAECVDRCWKKYGDAENRRPELEDRCCFISVL